MARSSPASAELLRSPSAVRPHRRSARTPASPASSAAPDLPSARRATAPTPAPGPEVPATIRAFSASDQCRHRAGPVRRAIRWNPPFVSSLTMARTPHTKAVRVHPSCTGEARPRLYPGRIGAGPLRWYSDMLSAPALTPGCAGVQATASPAKPKSAARPRSGFDPFVDGSATKAVGSNDRGGRPPCRGRARPPSHG